MMEIDGIMEPAIKLVDEYDNISTLTVTKEEDMNGSYFGLVTVDDSSFAEEEAIFCMSINQAEQLVTFLSDELDKIKEEKKNG